MDKRANRLKEYIEAWANAGRFSGSVLVAEKEEILLEKGFGYANAQYEIPNTKETKFKIGSYSKQFTAVAVLKLYEKGQIYLEDSVGKYLPDYKHGEGIKIHHLLSHMSGIPEHTAFEEYRTSERISYEIILKRLNQRQLDFEPGVRAEYSNSNYVLLAKLIEVVSGLEIEEFYKQELFKPLGLENTAVSRNEDIVKDLACGYSYSGEGLVNADYYDMSGAYGSGFLYSTLEDVLIWNKALLAGRIISKETLKKMLTPYGHIWYMKAYAGYGCFLKDETAKEMSAHGLISGYIFNVWVELESEQIGIIFGNNDTIAISKLMEGIKGILNGEAELPDILPNFKDSFNNPQQLEKLQGKYTCPYTGGTFCITLEGKQLCVDCLWVQEYKRKKYKLGFVDTNEGSVTFTCEVCEGTFVFYQGENGDIVKAVYDYDGIKLPYDRS